MKAMRRKEDKKVRFVLAQRSGGKATL